jgi:DNA-directed RNA polymerase subunit F
MIKSMISLSMAEALEYLKESEGKEAEVKGFIKKFTKLSPEKAKEIRKNIEALDLMKVREEHISEIINLIPETTEELNKIFKESGLDEDESKKIMDAIKGSK